MTTDLLSAPGPVGLRVMIAAAIFAVFLAGWLAHWLWSRLARAAAPREDRANELVAELLVVEEARDRAVADARATQAALRAEAEETRIRLEVQLREREAELAAAMETLRAARAETDEPRGR